MTGYSGNTKPTWVVDKERTKRAEAKETLWLFGIHAVRDALLNPNREKLRLVLTKNAADRLADALPHAGIEPEIVDPRKFQVPIAEDSVHQGAAMEVRPLNWGKLEDVCISGKGNALVVCLDRVTDPHNAGAVLRSAEVFGARAVIAPRHHSAPETGAVVYDEPVAGLIISLVAPDFAGRDFPSIKLFSFFMPQRLSRTRPIDHMRRQFPGLSCLER